MDLRPVPTVIRKGTHNHRAHLPDKHGTAGRKRLHTNTLKSDSGGARQQNKTTVTEFKRGEPTELKRWQAGRSGTHLESQHSGRREVGGSEFQVNLVHVVSSRPASAT